MSFEPVIVGNGLGGYDNLVTVRLAPISAVLPEVSDDTLASIDINRCDCQIFTIGDERYYLHSNQPVSVHYEIVGGESSHRREKKLVQKAKEPWYHRESRKGKRRWG